MHRQLMPIHAQQIVYGIQWVHTVVIPGTVHWILHLGKVAFYRLERHMLANSVCMHSDDPFPVTVIMNTNYESSNENFTSQDQGR